MSGKDELEEFLESGPWLTAENVREGQLIEILRVKVDRESYDNPRLVISGRDEHGNEVMVSMGKTNAINVAEKLGKRTSDWVGNYLKCSGTRFYPNFGRRGILWSGVLRAQAGQGGVGGWPTTG